MDRGDGVIATLTCTDVTVHADGIPIVDEVSLTVDDGTCCVVMGASGAGKSTLLRAIAGLADHTGAISVDGVDLAGRPPHRRRVGLLFQEPRLFPTRSALDNVAYPLRIRGVDRRARRARAAALLDEVGLGDRLDARPGELSGGERQRVALARALCSEPAVLMLDEPLTGLDVPQRRDLVRLLTRVRHERPVTWLVVSHDPDDAASLADTIAVMDHGRLVQHGPGDVVRRQPAAPLVASLNANPNLLIGRAHGGRLTIGGERLPWPASDGDVELTIRPEYLRLDGDDPTCGVGLAMTVVAVETRSSHTLAVTRGEAGCLEVPCTNPAPPVGATVRVHFDPSHLWQLPARPRAERLRPRDVDASDVPVPLEALR